MALRQIRLFDDEILRKKSFCHEIDHLEGILFTDLVTEYVK